MHRSASKLLCMQMRVSCSLLYTFFQPKTIALVTYYFIRDIGNHIISGDP
uniref:Uncharacterized protein n=1 Tax=Rhizophora mucronata TaxID=61149 RepID=A0A2P2MYE5_RHIMU